MVTVGGTSSITGPFVASLLLGVADVAGKYYVPALGAFVIYTVMIAVLVLRPQGLFARPKNAMIASPRGWRCEHLARPLALAGDRLLGGGLCRPVPARRQSSALLNEIAILALFALSLDLILGYAGIVSLGHAAFFGVGAYAAGLIAKHVTPDPLVGLAIAILAAALLGFLTSFLVLRGSDLTRLMVTLGVALVLGEIANALPLSPAAPTACRAWSMARCSAASSSTSTAAPPMPTAWRRCSCCSCWRGGSCIRRSACRCARSATTRCALRRSAFRSTAA